MQQLDIGEIEFHGLVANPRKSVNKLYSQYIPIYSIWQLRSVLSLNRLQSARLKSGYNIAEKWTICIHGTWHLTQTSITEWAICIFLFGNDLN